MPNKGFVASLFDMSFSSLVTTKVIKFIYTLTLIALTLFALLMVFLGFHRSAAVGVVVLLVIAPLWWFFALVYSRIGLEVIIALFRVMETNVELVALKRQQMGLIGNGHATATGSFATQPQTQPSYQVGDVVNGHRWNGTDWVPVTGS